MVIFNSYVKLPEGNISEIAMESSWKSESRSIFFMESSWKIGRKAIWEPHSLLWKTNIFNRECNKLK